MTRACIRCRTNGVDEDDNHGLCAECIYEEDELNGLTEEQAQSE